MKTVVRNIIHQWYFYVLAIILASLAMYLLTSYVNMPRNEETISLFVAACSSSKQNLYTELTNNQPSYLREIVINSAVYYSSDYDYIYTAYGKDGSDLIILPESKCFIESISYYYTELNTDYVNKEIPGASFYSDKDTGKKYGIKIRSSGDTVNDIIGFSNTTYDEDYYAFFYKDSLHAGKNNSSEYATSMDFVKLIMNYKKQ